MNQLIVIAYDIPSDKRRTKVANLLEDYGQRVQYSVFEARLSTGELQQLEKELGKQVDQNEDSIRFYRLCNTCYRQVKVLGLGTVAEDTVATII